MIKASDYEIVEELMKYSSDEKEDVQTPKPGPSLVIAEDEIHSQMRTAEPQHGSSRAVAEIHHEMRRVEPQPVPSHAVDEVKKLSLVSIFFTNLSLFDAESVKEVPLKLHPRLGLVHSNLNCYTCVKKKHC